MRKCSKSLQNEVTYEGSSSSDDASSSFDALAKDGNNSTSSPSVSLEDEASDNNKDVLVPELRSNKLHDKGGSSEVGAKEKK